MQSNLAQQIQVQNVRYQEDRLSECHRAIKTSCYEQFKNNNPDRAPGTCQWVLKNEKYAQWRQAQKNDLLWITADPGCGKSVLARSLIDRELQNTTTHTTCYFFFNDNQEQDNLATALCALLHQLFSAQLQLRQYAMDSWNKNHHRLQFEVFDLWRILLTATASEDAHPVTIIIDALDECCKEDRRTLIRLLSEFYIESLRPKARSSCLKFLVTSRPYGKIGAEFQGIGSTLPTVHLRGELENDKINKEINLVIRQELAALSEENGLEPRTIKKLEQELLAMEHRTYLWLHLVIQDIRDTFKTSLQPDSESIKSLSLPTSVEDAYEKILTRVPENRKEETTRILHIIIGARRPLTTSEMAIALCIDRRKGSQPFAEFKIEENRLKSSIPEMCGLFVFINHSKIYLIHQTARQFLIQKEVQEMTGRWRHSLDPNESDGIMASICVEYLSLDKVLRNKIGDLRFYSSVYWPIHFHFSEFKLEDEIITKARELCRVKSDSFQDWFTLLVHTKRPPFTEDMDDISIVAFNGHSRILKKILDTESVNLNAKDQYGHTALMWAAFLGDDKVVQMLLSKGANVKAQGGFYGTALQAASLGGQDKVVQMLLSKGVNVNAQIKGLSKSFGTALQVASAAGHDKTVQVLLSKGANVNAQSRFHSTALHEASHGGHDKTVQVLLSEGANVNAQDPFYGTALQAASLRGHDKVVQMLLSKGVKVNAQGVFYGTALQAASFRGHSKVVQMLLSEGANVNAQGGRFGNALHAASAGGHEKTVQVLLSKGANVNDQDGHFGTALWAVSSAGASAIVAQSRSSAEASETRLRKVLSAASELLVCCRL
jgi:ankyrin repeat protein